MTFAAKMMGALALAAALPVAAQAQTSCVPEFVQAAQTVTLDDIAVSSGGSTSEPFQLRIRNGSGDNGPCAATLRIARSSTSPSSGAIDYFLQARGQLLEILPSESFPGTAASDLDIAQLPGNTNGLALPFRLTVPSDWGLAEGSQIEDLIVFLLDENGVVTDQLRLTIVLNVPPSIELRIVGATGRDVIASVNLGTLDPESVNTSSPFGIRVWSTSPYSVMFSSENNGRLVHTSAPSTIDYRLFMNGSEVNLVGLPAASEPDGTDALGDFHPLQVRVAPFRARAGDYSDRVEVTVSAN